MKSYFRVGVTWLAAATVAACVGRSAAPPSCCAAPGYPRSQVESVLGKPLPPPSSRWHPLPSPPPNAPIYTTEHGYLTVTYTGANGLATHFSLDFFDGKAPGDAYRFGDAYLPVDATDTGGRAEGARSSIRIFKSEQLAKNLPATRGLLYVECFGSRPAVLCEKIDVALGSP